MLHPSIQCDPTHTLMTPLLVWFFSPAKVLCDITSGNNDTDELLNGQFQAEPDWGPAPDGERPTEPGC